MQPSSDQPDTDGGTGGSALRRFGPIIAIVVVVAIVAALVIAGGGDDDGEDEAADDTTEQEGPAERPEGAISWSQAQEEGIDGLTWPETCDQELGKVAIPVNFAPECYANVDDNGGATHSGVTEDTITVVVYSAQDEDAVLDFITAPIANDDTSEQSRQTVSAYMDLFNEYFQLYGRTVDYHFVEASGQSTDEVAAAADAARAIEQYQPFAAIGGPALTNAWSSAMADAGVVCMGCGLTGGADFLAARDPYLYSGGMAGVQNNLHVANYVEARLAGGTAEYGGEAVQDQERVFGHLYIRSTEEDDDEAQVLYDLLSERGVEIADDAKTTYSLNDLAQLPEQVASAITKLKAAGVTSVLLQADPYGPSVILAEATEQDFFPEWVMAGGVLLDTTAFGRTFDQEQWSHAFGFSSRVVPLTPDRDTGVFLHDWYTGEPPPAPDTAPVLWQNPFLFFRALQLAGPNLTPETFQDGVFSLDEGELRVTNSHGEYGPVPFWEEIGITTDYNGTDDKTEVWWDVDATGPDEINKEGTGALRFVDGGTRYLPDDWAGSENRLFQEEGSVTIYEEAPPDEEAPDYPSPAGGG